MGWSWRKRLDSREGFCKMWEVAVSYMRWKQSAAELAKVMLRGGQDRHQSEVLEKEKEDRIECLRSVESPNMVKGRRSRDR